MSGLGDFLHMGGYAAYVWPSYGATAAVLGGLLAGSLLRLRRAERRLAALEAMGSTPDDAA